MEHIGIHNASFFAGKVKSAGVSPPKETSAQAAPPPPREKVSSGPEINNFQGVDQAIAKRLAVIKELSNLYAVSDTRFTIYKQNGEFFTRVTNLRDGSVQTVPEPILFSSIGSGAILETFV